MEIRIIGVPVFEGCNIRGVDKAPAVIIESGIFDVLKGKHNVAFDNDIDIIRTPEEEMLNSHPSIKYYTTLLDMNNKLAEAVKSNSSAGAFTIILGGDHSLGAGSIAGSSIANNYNIGVVWIDAHSDMNTHLTSPSKNFHGMPLATSMYVGPREMRSIGADKRKVKPTDAFLVGVRSMDTGEVELKDTQGVNHYTIAFIRKRGMIVIAEEILETLRKNEINKIHLSFDLDVLSPEETTAYNCPVADGVTLDEAITLIKRLLLSGRVCSMDITEYNPDLDKDGKGLNAVKEIIKTIGECLS